MRYFWILILFLVGGLVRGNAQSYKVVHVSGTVLYSGAPLKIGDALEEEGINALDFVDDNAVASLFNPDKGKIRVSKKGRELVPANANSGATRPEVCKSIMSFGYLKSKAYNYLILGTIYQPVSAEDLPLKNPQKQYFKVRYKYDGKIVERKLKSTEMNEVILSRADILGDDNPALAHSFQIVYEDGFSRKESKFQPVFVNEEELKQELLAAGLIQAEDPFATLEKVKGYLQAYYGSISNVALKNWLAEQLGLQFNEQAGNSN
ncbi:MAG: hypothetical protein RML72_05560 [Bacteroidia bacterium]|nr:hypothetical protein [Bacteroidia bacterium]